tara:strand:- start:46 stop:528 length:483 start_codon:yes stop_codon:yes gene_type:complete
MVRNLLLVPIILLVTSCAITPYAPEIEQKHEGSFFQCSTPWDVKTTTLSLNLETFENEVFNLSKLVPILGNPVDKKNIDNQDYYYFGTLGQSGGCAVSFAVKDSVTLGVSTVGSDNSCGAFSQKSIQHIGDFYFMYTGFQFNLGEGNCGDWTIYKNKKEA